jgi:ATP-dependent helicase/DNAse subunit B
VERPVRAPRRAPQAVQEAALTSPAVLAHIRDASVAFSASELREFARCPFKHFAGNVLRLTGRPRQERGITSQVAGEIIHETIAEWCRDERRADIGTLFESVFEKHTRGMALRHSDDKMRARMLDDLRRFAERENLHGQIYRTGMDPRFLEYSFRFPLELPGDRSIEIHGRIDRVEILKTFGDRPLGLAVDFKYSSKPFQKKRLKEVEDGEEYQIPAYLMALDHLGFRPAGIEFQNLRGKPDRRGVLESALVRETISADRAPGILQSLDGLVQIGARNMREKATSIRQGKISVEPKDSRYCHIGPHGCDYFDLCRITKWRL